MRIDQSWWWIVRIHLSAWWISRIDQSSWSIMRTDQSSWWIMRIDLSSWLTIRINLREFVNYRNPDLWRVVKWGFALRSLPPFLLDPLDPLDPPLRSFLLRFGVKTDTWWHLPSKTLRKIEVPGNFLHFTREVCYFYELRPSRCHQTAQVPQMQNRSPRYSRCLKISVWGLALGSLYI